jgi:two-component system, sensor histidine kinase and response regulator
MSHNHEFARSPSLPPAARPGLPRRERAGVWLVDDSPAQLEVCRAALEPLFQVSAFTSGGAALEQLDAGPLPEAVVLDWHMPDMSGIEVCRFIRGQFDLAELPVLILTASGTGEALLEALAAGANDFVQKPVSDHEVRARVAGLVRLSAAHAELQTMQRTLQVEAEFRERFMGMLAHDLRQPLNTIHLATQALALPEGAAGRVSGALGMQQRAVSRMKRMIDELLDFTRSRPETGMPIQRQTTDLAAIARATLDEMRPGWPAHTLTLHAERACLGTWDPDRLAQVCSNLIGNALEHSAPNSPIDVRVACSENHAELTVSNLGAVIPDSVLATLFEAFRRGRSVKPSSSGVGLGLYIVDQIVRAHGGSIVADSSEAGTHFRVRLPCDS